MINNFDPLGNTSRTGVERGIAYYTWHLAWLDSSHYSLGKGGGELASAWRVLEGTAEGQPFVFDMKMTSGTLKPISYLVCIIPEASSKERKEQLLAARVRLTRMNHTSCDFRI